MIQPPQGPSGAPLLEPWGGSGSRLSAALVPVPLGARATGSLLKGFVKLSGSPNSTLAKLITAAMIENSRLTVLAADHLPNTPARGLDPVQHLIADLPGILTGYLRQGHVTATHRYVCCPDDMPCQHHRALIRFRIITAKPLFVIEPQGIPQPRLRRPVAVWPKAQQVDALVIYRRGPNRLIPSVLRVALCDAVSLVALILLLRHLPQSDRHGGAGLWRKCPGQSDQRAINPRRERDA